MDTLIQIQYSALNSVAILHISGIISSYMGKTLNGTIK